MNHHNQALTASACQCLPEHWGRGFFERVQETEGNVGPGERPIRAVPSRKTGRADSTGVTGWRSRRVHAIIALSMKTLIWLVSRLFSPLSRKKSVLQLLSITVPRQTLRI